MTPALYPALKSNHLYCPCPGHFAETQCGKTGCCQSQKTPSGVWVNYPNLSVSAFCFMGWIFGKTASRHNRAQRGQYRVSISQRCMDATQPAGWAQTSSQALTRGGCDSRRGLLLLVEIALLEKSAPVFHFPELFESIGFGRRTSSLITA